MAPAAVTTACAAAYPPALAAVLPEARHATGTLSQQRIARDHRHRKGRLRGMRGFKTRAGARVRCRAHALLRNRRHGGDDLGWTSVATPLPGVPAAVAAWAALTAALLTW